MTKRKDTRFREKLLAYETWPRATSSSVLPYENETELLEAVENFQAYLRILREWDERDRFQ